MLRSDIERALDELISNEEGMRFQGLAVVLAKQKWPELIACERKWDRGLDAHAHASLSSGAKGIALACSLTATLEKIEADARKTKENFGDVNVLIFATPQKVTNHAARTWAASVSEKFGYELIVMPREDIIASLMLPSNGAVCRSHLGIPVAVEEEVADLLQKAHVASSEETAGWLAHPRLTGKPLLTLQAVKLDEEAKETRELFDLASVEGSLMEGRRIVLEAPAGRGKTTTLVQLAQRLGKSARLAFLVDFPSWVRSRQSILEFIARTPPFRSRRIDEGNLARLYRTEHFSFLLNGWNEISEKNSEEAARALAELERSFPAAGIIVATRTHHISPPLPGSFRAKLLPLNRAQRTEYLKMSLADRAEALGSQLDENHVLDELTRTPLILVEVATIFRSGGAIPTTKLGVLGSVMKLLQQSEEHRDHLQHPPLTGHASNYLTDLSVQMTTLGDVTISEQRACSICSSVSARLKASGQIVTLPEPASILNTLCAHHVLERLEYPSVAFRFQHQQFQEFYASSLLKRQLWELVGKDDTAANLSFGKKYLNEPVWDEPLRMIAEEIGVKAMEASDQPGAVAAGRRLIELTLPIDPIFASELSRLCGPAVWRGVRSVVSERLRSWYRAADDDNRKCATAGMLATGSDEFVDIVLPLLTNDDQMVRMRTCRTWGEFQLSTLGTEWRSIVNGWKEEHRIDFVREVARNRRMAAIAESFAITDPSAKVRAEAIKVLSWVGATGALDRVLTALDKEAFAEVLPSLFLRAIPASLRPRLMEVYSELLKESGDPISNISTLLQMAEIGNTNIAESLKEQLVRCDAGRLGNPLVESALKTVRKNDPEWVSHWVAERIVDGALWGDNWLTFVSIVPESLKASLLERIAGQSLQPIEASRIISVLSAVADPVLAERVFSRLCEVKKAISTSTAIGENNETNWMISRQLEELLRAIAPNVVVLGLSNRLAGEFNATEFNALVDTFGRIGPEGSYLRSDLQENLRQNLRRYLTDAIPFALRQDDPDGRVKVQLALALARVGDPEDMVYLSQLIDADIQRMRPGRP